MNRPFAIMMPWGRVGSNLITATLSEACGIGIASEPTTSMRSRAKGRPEDLFHVDKEQIDYLREFPPRRTGILPGRAPYRGVKLSHQSLISPMLAYAVLRERGFRVVAMDRSNHIKSAISQIRAMQHGAWSVRAGRPRPAATRIQAARAVSTARTFARASRQMQDYLAHFFPDDRMDLLYEDLNADPHAAIAQVAAFLDLRLPGRFELAHRKATGDDLSQVVLNWDEVRAAFADSEFAPLLDD